jgi:FKBP-type peptidyl-prolyl cis-trans isomerase
MITIREGTGDQAAIPDVVIVDYKGWVQETGTLFDDSYGAGDVPFTVTLGRGQVIDGWEEGLQLMTEGGAYRLIIPPELAYGEAGQGDTIPPNSTLIFDMEILGVFKPGETFSPTPSPAPAPSATATGTGTPSPSPTPSPAATETPGG